MRLGAYGRGVGSYAKNKEKRGIWLNWKWTDRKTGIKKEYCIKQFKKYIATDFCGFIDVGEESYDFR